MNYPSGKLNIYEIKEQLQKEVDAILSGVSDSTVYAEFDRDEIVDLQNDQSDLSRLHVIEDNNLTLGQPVYHSERITITRQRNPVTKAMRTLFRPFGLYN